MSLSLDDLQGELREYYARIEEVLGGMDSLLAQLQDRVAKLEGNPAHQGAASNPSSSIEQRVARMEGQLGALVESLCGEGSDPYPADDGIYLGR